MLAARDEFRPVHAGEARGKRGEGDIFQHGNNPRKPDRDAIRRGLLELPPLRVTESRHNILLNPLVWPPAQKAQGNR